MRGKFIISIYAFIMTLPGFSQEVMVKGGFVEDSMKIGQTTHFWITASYPPQFQVVFPDSLFDYSPFEYMGKTFSPTRAKGEVYFDSTTYQIQSFEIDNTQYFKLPATILHNKDSTLIYTPLDSISLIQLATHVSDTTQLITNTEYWDVKGSMNYPLLWIILGTLIILSIAVFFLFGKKIRRYFKLKRLRKEYTRFSEQLTQSIRSMREQPRKEEIEQSYNQWKSFLERLEGIPYTRLTSKEILKLKETSELKEVLKNIDRCIYGNGDTNGVYKDFQSIEDYTQHRYSVIVNEIKNN